MSGYGFTSAGTTYDDEDRLTGFARTNGIFNQSWNLTKVGDWTSVTTNGTAQNRTHGPTHELLTAGGQNISTDVKGNITLLPSNLTPQSSPLALQWDFDNKLKGADLGNNSSVDVNFQYDALGRRVARTGTGGSVVYVQHDQQTIADYPVGGVASTPTNRYVYASYIDEPVVRKAAGTSGTIHYYHRNQQYSITAMTTSTGAVAERYAYTAYGQPTILNASGSVLTSSAVGNRYTYTGREWDETLCLHHFRARWMSPLAGRFLGRDPIGWADGPSLYRAYFSEHGVDPLGTECIGLSSPIPGLLGTGGMWNDGPEKGQFGVVGYDIDINTRFSGEACTKKCPCGDEVTDYQLGIELTGRAEFFVASYGGSYSDGFIDASYWLGAKSSIGITGSASVFFHTDNCNCPGKLLGGGCFEFGGTVAMALGGEGSFSIKMPWWMQQFNPLKNARLSVYGEVRGYATYKKCRICSCNNGCKITNQLCLRGEATANVSVFGEVAGKLVGYGITTTLWKDEKCINI